MSEINKLNERVTTVETYMQDMKNTVSTKILALTNENINLNKEISLLKKHVRQQQNSVVAHDIRIHGIPYAEDENLFDIYLKLCQISNVNAPNISAIYRISAKKKYPNMTANKKSDTNIRDPDIIVKFKCPYDRNYVLKSITSYIKSTKDVLRLNIVGFDSTVPFYVNENLSPESHNILQQALRLKRSKIIATAFVSRGLVYIKKNGQNEPIHIENCRMLHSLFRLSDDN